MIKEQKYTAGKLLNVDIQPYYERNISTNTDRRKIHKTPEQMKAENVRKQIKIAIRKANATFTNEDYFCHFTFTPENSPQTIEEAQNIFDRFIKRLRYQRKKRGLCDLQVMYGIHNEPYKSGINIGLPRYHYHALITGRGMNMNTVLNIWGYGTMNKIDYYQPELYGPEAAVRYICDRPAGKRLYYCTRNLNEPKKRKASIGKLCRSEVAAMAQRYVDDKKYWEKRYRGYKFYRCDAVFNEINGHWYLSVYMMKKESE